MNRYCSRARSYASGPLSMRVHPSSAPSEYVGKISSPVLRFLAGLMIVPTDSTCDAVRQSGPTGPWHLIVAGSNEHFNGFSISPSLTPSSASHLARTARSIVENCVGGTTLSLSLKSACAIQRRQASRLDLGLAAAPAMIPLKSVG